MENVSQIQDIYFGYVDTAKTSSCDFEVSHPCCVYSVQNHKIYLISQNTTVLTKVVHAVSTVSTTYFGLYIGHHQVSI
jgi:hypothetical protein